MGYLGALQADARSKSIQPELHDADAGHPNVLSEMRERHEIRGAPELDRGTVDALAEMFKFVFADQSIPPEMKVLIGRLQILVLKAAMIDRDIFLSDQHPARRLVDTLSGASVAWAPDKGENNPLYLRVKHTEQQLDERRTAGLPSLKEEFDVHSNTQVGGLWFDFLAEGQTHVRCRLSWVSPMRTRFLCTNRDGFDAFVRSEREVTGMLRLGRLVALEHAPIVASAGQIAAGATRLAGGLTAPASELFLRRNFWNSLLPVHTLLHYTRRFLV